MLVRVRPAPLESPGVQDASDEPVAEMSLKVIGASPVGDHFTLYIEPTGAHTVGKRPAASHASGLEIGVDSPESEYTVCGVVVPLL